MYSATHSTMFLISHFNVAYLLAHDCTAFIDIYWVNGTCILLNIIQIEMSTKDTRCTLQSIYIYLVHTYILYYIHILIHLYINIVLTHIYLLSLFHKITRLFIFIWFICILETLTLPHWHTLIHLHIYLIIFTYVYTTVYRYVCLFKHF